MKTKIKAFLSKPKTIIPIAATVAILIGVILYPKLGAAPQVNVLLSDDQNSSRISSGQSVDLAFPKSGRVESVLIKKGDKVSKGQTLARLSAPDALGLVNQAKSAISLAQAQYAALNLDYAKTKEQQDTIVANAYQTLLKTSPEAIARNDSSDNVSSTYPLPTISGNYILNREGTITIKTYEASGGLAFTASGLEDAKGIITSTPIPLGNSGLSILFPSSIASGLTWTITLPNTRSINYATNKNAYDLAIANRARTLSALEANIGNTNNGDASVAKAQINAAEGAYQAALGAYQNNVIVSPINGTISFVDENLKVGQSVNTGKTVISIIAE